MLATNNAPATKLIGTHDLTVCAQSHFSHEREGAFCSDDHRIISGNKDCLIFFFFF